MFNMAALSITSFAKYFSDEPKSLNRGENHYQSGHVLSFCYCDGIIRGSVQASMKSTTYKVTIYLQENEIRSTECECPRGGSKCSHAVALFLHGYHNLSRTDIECQWKKQKASEVVKTVEDLYPPKETKVLKRKTTDEDREWLRNKLKRYGEFTGMLWLLSPEPDKENRLPISTVEEIILSREFVESGLDTNFLLEKLKVSEQQVKSVCEITKEQRECGEWHVVRKGRLTASNFGPVLEAKRVTPSLIKRVLGEYDISRVQAVRWGVVNEKEGIKAFTKLTMKVVKDCGLWLHKSGVLGASPDGLVDDNAIIEVKCPYTHRNSTIEEAVKDPKFCLVKRGAGYCLKQSHHYWHQVQGQLFITGKQICYFVVWTTMQTVVLAIQKDCTWEPNLLSLQEFYTIHMIPALVDGGL